MFDNVPDDNFGTRNRREQRDRSFFLVLNIVRSSIIDFFLLADSFLF